MSHGPLLHSGVEARLRLIQEWFQCDREQALGVAVQLLYDVAHALSDENCRCFLIHGMEAGDLYPSNFGVSARELGLSRLKIRNGSR